MNQRTVKGAEPTSSVFDEARFRRCATVSRTVADIDPSPFLGYWKITWMEVWAQKYVDLVVPGFVEFMLEEEQLAGAFQFGTVVGWLDCRLRDIGGMTLIEWSWEGRSDTDPASGRGWASVVDGELVGHIFIHSADDSAFKATRHSRPVQRPPGSRRRASVSKPTQLH